MTGRLLGMWTFASLLLHSALTAAQPAPRAPAIELPLTLEACIAVALERNVPLAAASLESAAVEKEAGAALGTWLPEFGLAAVRTNAHGDSDGLGSPEQGTFVETTVNEVAARLTQRLPLGGSLQLLYDLAQTGEEYRGGHAAGFLITQPLLRDAGWRRATADVSDARLAAAGEEATLRAQLLDVVFKVKSSYYQVLRRAKLIEVNQQAIARDQQLLDFSQAKVEAKLATRRDVLSAEIILAQDRSRLVNSETEHAAALDALADVLGLPLEDSLAVVAIELGLDPIADEQPRWVEKALRDNPDLLRARIDLERDELAKNVAGNSRLPRLDLKVAYDDARDAIPQGATTLDARRGARTWQGAIEVAMPILNKPLGDNYRAAQLRHERGQKLRQEAERQTVLEVRDTARNLRRIEERIEVLTKEIQGARDKVEFANVNFQLGRASNLDITDAQEDLVNAESDFVDEVVSYRVELARLEQLLGGSLE
ncbi:MAG TPA: TolC family protein [Candidatus Krumholzibacteria bacterium]|nr:TolC family protein [Candidatus Krumholzibacteria bacterium]